MKNIAIALLFSLIACNTEKINAEISNDIIAEFAFSGLAYDGCDTRIIVENGTSTPNTYKASKETEAVLNKFIEIEQAKLSNGDYLKSFPIKISFKKTGKMAVLLCGWGFKSNVETIDIQQISRKN